jgi:HTH-type transcriptional regulator, transcriptional repressor of NAD biosynthesis genes
MKRGLVIGKFLPVHKGHLALIGFAAAHCDELIVSMSRRVDDSIDPELRLSWLKEIYRNDPAIRVEMIDDNFDDEDASWPVRTKKWAEVISKVYPRIDVVVSSEEYGPYFAKNLGAESIVFDQLRNRVPVSATLIRSQPLRYWEFIPDVVKPYFLKKICFYGPESTGKTVMTQRMASMFNTVSVPEVAREFLITNSFTAEDIIAIGKAHDERILAKTKEANKILFVDTDAITTQIYSAHYLNVVPEILLEFERQTRFDHYFLFDIDVPWVADGLRDLGDRREEMFGRFKRALEDRKVEYTLVGGDWEKRKRTIIEKLLSLFPGLTVV